MNLYSYVSPSQGYVVLSIAQKDLYTPQEVNYCKEANRSKVPLAEVYYCDQNDCKTYSIISRNSRLAILSDTVAKKK